MKLVLVVSQLACLSSVLWSTPRRYPLTVFYLAMAIPATLVFRTDGAWLQSWYILLCGPVVFLRLAAGVEIAHRQTEGFAYWSRLMGSVFLLAGMFAGLAWIQHPGNFFQSFIEFRRLLQLFTGAVFLVLETFWVCMGGGWYRRSDWIAVWFGVLCMNHATVSVFAGLSGFDAGVWSTFQLGSWGIDAVCYLALTVRFQARVRAVQSAT